MRSSIVAALGLPSDSTFALYAVFSDPPCNFADGWNYFIQDGGPDINICYNTCEGLKAAEGSACRYYKNGGREGPLTCRSDGVPFPFDTVSVAVDMRFTPLGTVCDFYTMPNCYSETLAEVAHMSYTVTTGECSNVPQKLPLVNKQTVSSFSCRAP